MNQILVISWREMTRLCKRFSGGASPLAVILLLAVLGLSAFALRNTVSLGSGLYRVGVVGDTPAIQDSRFSVIQVDAAEGQRLLDQQIIDALINGAQVVARDDNKSQYAVRTLKQYLETQELIRIGQTYPAASAFPLKVGINYLSQPIVTGQDNPPAAKPEEVIVPSLTHPPAPFTQVLVALIYIMPITFISIFFTSSFMDEKINRRLTILLSAPITPFQIILGKMLPYATFALFTTVLIAWLTNGNIPLALAIFAPTIMFIFAVYLMVPMFYRTFKDITFIAMLVSTLTTAYLIFPAMFTNVNDFSYLSPLTLAVKMYRNEPFGWREYLFPSFPMAAIFGIAMFAGTRMLNEEFLIGYRPIKRKIADAIYLLLARMQPWLAALIWSFLAIPAVYMTQMALLAFASNLPARLIIVVALFASVFVEELTKSISLVVLAEHDKVNSAFQVFSLAFFSALGFLIGEKSLLLISVGVVSKSAITSALLGEGFWLLVTLIAHFLFTSIVGLLRVRLKWSYLVSLTLGAAVHFFYNWYMLRGIL